MIIDIMMSVSSNKVILEQVFKDFVEKLKKDNPEAEIKLNNLGYIAFSKEPIDDKAFRKMIKGEQPEEKQEAKSKEDDKITLELFGGGSRKTFNFVVALNCLKKGLLVSRAEWGINRFLKLSESKIKPNGEANIEVGPIDGKFSVWYASQDDMAAEDWYVVSPFPVMPKIVGVDSLATD